MSDDTRIVRVQVLPHAEGLALPTYGTPGAAGVDLRAAIAAPIELWPGERTLVPTGLCVALPLGHELQIRPRSGLALKRGITVLNTPGTIDEDYRGEIGVILLNASDPGNPEDKAEPFIIKRGDRIAQAVLAPVVRFEWHRVQSVDQTDRGAGGFGSTGA